jgi:hypothetical protein
MLSKPSLWLLRHAGQAPLLVAALWLPVLGIAWVSGRARPGAGWVTLAVASVLAVALWRVWARWQHEKVLREAPLPQYLKLKLRRAYPQLSDKDAHLVERGLRQFFLACLRSKKAFVAMPSKAVDAMWHEFILHTQAYQEWCELALGWFLHHTPAEALGAQAKGNDGLRRAWFWACRDEAINPKAPSRLPLLFALDAKLEIADGFRYQPDCRDIHRKSDAGGDGVGALYCGTSFSDGSFSGDADGFGGCDASSSDSSSGDSSSSSSDGGGDGGGSSCGGGGCGGGGD